MKFVVIALELTALSLNTELKYSGFFYGNYDLKFC